MHQGTVSGRAWLLCARYAQLKHTYIILIEESDTMKMEQLSIFLENKSGRLTEVTGILGAAGINLLALTIADNSDFGTLRCIVSDTTKAVQVLKDAHFAVKRTQVVAFTCKNVPGSLAEVMKHISRAGILIEYMYSFAWDEKSIVVLRPSDIEVCVALLDTLPGIALLANNRF